MSQTTLAELCLRTEQLDMIIRCFNGFAYIKNPEARVIYVSPGFAEELGRDETISAGCREEELWEDEVLAALREDEQRLTATGDAVESTHEIPVRGQKRSLVTTRFRTVGESGEPLIVTVFRDITDDLQARKALVDSEERFRLFMRHLPLFAFIKDEAGRLVYVNETFSQVTGVPIDQLLGNIDWQWLPADVAARYAADDEAVRSTGEPLRRVEEIPTPQGMRLFQMQKFPLFREGQAPLVGAVGQDVSDVVQARQEAREISRQYELLVESASSVILHWGSDGRIRFINSYGAHLFGYEPEELLGQPISVLIPEDPSDGRDLAQLTDQILRNPQAFAYNENENITRDGRRLWISWTNRVVADDSGRPEALLAIGIDRTRQHEAELLLRQHEQRLRNLTAELALAEGRERRRLATLLHDDLSQSLALAKMRLAMLLSRPHDEIVTRELRQVQEMVEEAVAGSRSIILELSPPALDEVGLAGALQALGGQLQSRHGLSFHLQHDGLPVPLSATSRTTVYQMVRELLANVVKHAQATNVWVRLSVSDSRLWVEVEDDGAGFEPGLSPPRPVGGGGFGLFSIRERLEYMGGDMSINSEVGSGTRVVLHVPLSALPEQTQGPAEAEP